ncbi:MAG: Eco57I restriction-modification methylase domain-containing protein [Bacteroidaceae bacterium]|nr:Eco57I restriction-modification methylase domain-containing protein [Bacteroidaceae bacterium]
MEKDYNPDVLNCIANLSNDEVFTPPVLANQLLDLLPQELFQSPDTTFLDPFCKSGVFLREIVKRLDKGLENIIPNRQKRIDHIMHHQVFGIAITELTSLLSRRSLYCSKRANSQHSVSYFDNEQGNVLYKALLHTWVNGKCKYCGASKDVYDRSSEAEQYAYQFIHTDNPEKIFNMKFDVIIGNPPYQIEDGGSKASATPIYNLFVEQAKKLNPRFLSMIIPARWYAGGKGLDSFRDNMLSDKHILKMVDFFDAEECFPGIDISGGVCYFLWSRDQKDDCEVVNVRKNEKSVMKRALLEGENSSFIRFNNAISILNKSRDNSLSFSNIVSARKPFGIDTKPNIFEKNQSGRTFIYAYPNSGYVSTNIISYNRDIIDKYKVMISYAYGERGDFPYFVIGKPFIAAPNSCCSETYLVVGNFDTQETCENCISYMKTKFFRFLVLLSKNTQHATSKVYQFVPLQDFSHPWTDEMLYEKYGLDEKEIAFIESMIRPME